ncbi:MAG: hypothetical protein JST38_10360 [Bacteroidetes bacterium]|nr:hypothetical protein [Bacteroidota bacterium]
MDHHNSPPDPSSHEDEGVVSKEADAQPPELGSFETKYPYVAEALLAVHAGADRGRWGKDRREAIEAELHLINERMEPLFDVVAKHYVEQALTGPLLIRFSLAATDHLGFSDPTNEFMARLWVEVLSAWRKEEQIAFVQSIADQSGRDIFEVLEFAKEVFARFDFSAEVMLPWIVRVRATIGQDLMQNGMWACIENFCKRCPGEALRVIGQWQHKDPDEQSRRAIARMVASLRIAVLDKEELAGEMTAFDSMLSAPGSPELRSEYIESWAFMLDSPLLTDGLLLSMRRELYTPGGKEEIAWSFLLARMTRAKPERWSAAYTELQLLARPDLGPNQKYWVVEAALDGWSRATREHQVLRDQWEDLFFSVQPLSETDFGAWRSVEMLLSKALREHPEEAAKFIVRLAEASGKTWEKLLRGPARVHEGLSHTLKQAPNVAEIITRLCLSSIRAARRVGLEWFHRCETVCLDEAMVSAADLGVIEAVFLEAMVFPLLSEDTARLHGCLLRRIETLGGPLDAAFYDEVEHQTMDTHGYRKRIVESSGGHPRITQMVDEAKKRIDATYGVRTSSALQMVVPGHSRAMALWMRRTVRQTRKGAMENSFTRLFTNISILYAKKWRMQGPDGSLGEASELNKVSVEGEMPRLEAMMPEALTIKRISAEMRLREIQRTLTPGEA